MTEGKLLSAEELAEITIRDAPGREANGWMFSLDGQDRMKLLDHITALTKENEHRRGELQAWFDKAREQTRRAEAAEAELARFKSRLIPDGCVAVCKRCAGDYEDGLVRCHKGYLPHVVCPLKPKEPTREK